MTATHLQLIHEDLAALLRYFPTLSFTRGEQIEALLCSETADFQAAPGSGKTTLLGAKLALMASRWPHAHRGICVLTHTNVAREEIERSLRAAPHGDLLLGYPHFIGTIQAFVNKFLALPWLRTLGIEVREIDEEHFEEEFLRRARRFASGWISQSPEVRGRTIRGVRYRGPDLDLVSNGEVPLPKSGVTIEGLRTLKATMALEGRFRHEDMFAYAEQAIAKVPRLAAAVEFRFPNVFIDEMQDTNDVQLEVLSHVFNAASVVQRFGDVNQAILNRGARATENAFPSPDCREVRTSLRFGPTIASVANRVKGVGGDIDGQGPDAVTPPTLILYSDSTVTHVIERFGEWVGRLMPQEVLGPLPVKAVCAIKSPGNLKQRVGRHVTDYFPSFDDAIAASQPRHQSVRQLLRMASMSSAGGRADKRVSAARGALLLAIKTYGHPEYKDVKTYRELARLLSDAPERVARVRYIALRAVSGVYDMSTEASSEVAIVQVIADLGDIIDVDADITNIPEEWLLAREIEAGEGPLASNSVSVKTANGSFPVHVATIAAVKGETHLATLVLESCRNRTYDIRTMLPYFYGGVAAVSATKEDERTRLMNMFVAASRPRRLLAFAMHIDRAASQAREKLTEDGWDVLDWSVDSPAVDKEVTVKAGPVEDVPLAG